MDNSNSTAAQAQPNPFEQMQQLAQLAEQQKKAQEREAQFNEQQKALRLEAAEFARTFATVNTQLIKQRDTDISSGENLRLFHDSYLAARQVFMDKESL